MTEKKKTTALARIPPKELEAASRSVHALAELFGEDQYNLLTPLTHMALPRGTKLAITEVRIDTKVDKWGAGEDLVRVAGGKYMIRKHKLDQISLAAGIGWTEEKRVDGGAHPHYCEMLVKGKMTCFDGSVIPLTGHKVTDLREKIQGAPGVRGKDWEEMTSKNKDPAKQIMEARKFIAENTASKAKNRAIAQGLGIQRSYTMETLSKPFVVVKPVPDPDDNEAREVIIANAAGATDALYGSREPAQVIDVEAEFVEPDATREPDNSAAGGGNTAPEEITIPETGEVITPVESVTRDYYRYKQNGGNDEGFKQLFTRATGRESSAGSTAVEAIAVTTAVSAYLANKDGRPGQGGLPL